VTRLLGGPGTEGMIAESTQLTKALADGVASSGDASKGARRVPCRAPPMPTEGAACTGGKSTGPRTAEGRERCRLARWKHGFSAQAAVAERKRVRAAIAECVSS
jgi:hypothetical protein